MGEKEAETRIQEVEWVDMTPERKMPLNLFQTHDVGGGTTLVFRIEVSAIQSSFYFFQFCSQNKHILEKPVFFHLRSTHSNVWGLIEMYCHRCTVWCISIRHITE